MNSRSVVMTQEEILARWRTAGGWEPLPCGAEAAHPEHLDRLLAAYIDAWYCHALLTAEPFLLPIGDFAGEAYARLLTDGSAVELTLPPQCLRPVSVKLWGWHRAANVTTDADGSLALMQLNPFSRADCSSPVAIMVSPDTLFLYPVPDKGDGTTIDTLTGVPAPQTGTYLITPFLLADMTEKSKNLFENGIR